MKPLRLFLMIIFVLTLILAISACDDGSNDTDGDTSTDGDTTEVVDGDIETVDGDTTEVVDGDIETVDGDTTEVVDGDIETVDGDTTEVVDGDLEYVERDSDTVPLTWTDTSTGFTWQWLPTGGEMGLEEAEAHCADLSLDGHEDWRLPNISELRTIIRGCTETETDGLCGVQDECSACNVDSGDICVVNTCWSEDCSGCVVNGGPSDDCYWPEEIGGTCSWFWSSSRTNLDYRAWAVAFRNGSMGEYGKTEPYYVRCMRDGQ